MSTLTVVSLAVMGVLLFLLGANVTRHRAIRGRTGGDFTAKDFRTLRGTVAAADRLAQLGTASTKRARAAAVREAIEYASQVLGNTPAIAKASYVDPRVVEAYEHGRLVRLRGLRETALLQLLVDDASE